MKYLCRVSYDGYSFNGYQIQKKLTTFGSTITLTDSEHYCIRFKRLEFDDEIT